jgi:hypothetical protein
VKDDNNLSLSRYIGTGTAETYRPIPELLKEISALEGEEKHDRRELNKIFIKLGYDPEA